ncbi:MAG: hypothetical protein IKZ58_08645 [Selenomonadaceae bacterium]|nr:hypothetical protein [Selenomonadaceae bacterium]
MKKLFALKINEKGFVLIEFVIALPLIILLLYGLAQSTLMIFRAAKEQAADYVLEVEAQDFLTRVTQDLRAASYVKRGDAIGGTEIDKIEIHYHGSSTKYYEKGKIKSNDLKIFDIVDTRIYNVARAGNHGAYIYAQRKNDYHYNPITGGNFFGDTIVNKLKYSKLDDRVIHIDLEMQSIETNRIIKISTAVFMPACDEMIGF